MATDTPHAAARTTRPNPILLVLLGIAVLAFLVMRLGGSAGPEVPASNVRGAAAPAIPGETIDPAMLDVRLERLEEERPGFGRTERNPFRFQQRAALPIASGGARAGAAAVGGPVAPLPPPEGAPPPPITVRFIGFLDRQDGSKVAMFVDCTVGRRTSHAREGEIVDGRYRLVRIGLQSVVVEHLDGRGRTTLPQTGQDCVGK